MRRVFFVAILISLLSLSLNAQTNPPSDSVGSTNQTIYSDPLDFQATLTEYVAGLYTDYGFRQIPQERYLISLMYLINAEVSGRLENPDAAREKYFSELHNMLGEMRQLKRRLRTAGIRELDDFVNDLEGRVRLTLENRDVDFRKKKVFQDALQMLYVSEEMIKLDNVQGPGGLTQKIGESKAQLLSAFGEVESGGSSGSGLPPSIYDLFVEWRRTDQAKYELRLTDVYLARRNLLNSGGTAAVQRMFRKQLERAYIHFNRAEYDLAERLLSDLSKSYPEWGVRNMDDVQFYMAESNFALDRLVHARDDYELLVNDYPNSTFLANAYSRLVQISYNLRDYLNAIYYAELFERIADPNSEDYYDIQFLVSMSHYQLGNYDKIVQILLNIPEDHPYYYLAQYFVGNAYAANQLYDDAIGVYIGLIDNKLTPPYLHARALYKMGILEYERNNYTATIGYLGRISSAFSRFDKVLNAMAWAHFENERSKEADALVDFTQARFYARRLLDEYYASPYVMEATGLLAFIKQLENEPIQAIGLYQDVYQAKVQRTSVQNFLDEREHLERLYLDAKAMRDKSLRTKNTVAYGKATQLMGELYSQISEMDLAESSSSGAAMYREVEHVLGQLRELNRLRLRAEETGRYETVQRIDSLQFRLGAVLEAFPEEVVEQSSGYVNYFDDYPISKYVVEETSRHQAIKEKRELVKSEIALIDDLMLAAETSKKQALESQNFRLVSRLEQKKIALEDLRKEYDQLLVATYAVQTNEDPYPEFSRWGDLGAFGIINVYFDQKQKTQKNLVQVANVLDRVNVQLNHRKEVIESKIRKIESEVRFMTMKARMEERARLRAERERAFRESYFDTRESESEEE